MAVKARAYPEVREVRPPPSAATVKTRFYKSNRPGGQTGPPAERVSFRSFFDIASPFGHWAGARRSPPDHHDFWRSVPGTAAIGHCSAVHGRGLASDPVGWSLRSRRAGLLPDHRRRVDI